MRNIIKGRQILADDWRYPGDPPESGASPTHVVLPLAELISARKGAGTQARGVKLAPADAVEELASFLQGIELVTVEFTGPTEGRGYTQGRLLRERYDYQGEVRAVGAVKRDQLYFLARCGFDAYDLATGEDLEQALAYLDRFSVAYQATTAELVHPSRRAV